MSEKLTKPYEISIWEDELTQIEDSNSDEYNFVEKKLAIIGSNTMTGVNKIYDPVFHKKANGEKTLTFSLKYKYFDPYLGNDDIINPFAALLTNERKVKLYYDNEWYEFVIKERVESSEEYTWNYVCTDAFVLELSKRGYNITFDTELNNNQGTARELAEETLKDTEWQIPENGVDNFKQLIAEPVYKATLVSTDGIEIINANGNNDEVPSAPSSIYLFYNYVKNQNGKFVQFIVYDENKQYVIDDKNVITDTNFRIKTDLIYSNDNGNITFKTENNTTIIVVEEIETKYQANRLAYNQLTTYDSVMQHTVDRFQIRETDQEIYRYIDYTYTTSNVVINYITNGNNFNLLEDGTLQGWNPYVDSTDTVKKLELVTKPELSVGAKLVDLSTLSQVEGFLKVQFNGALTSNYENAIFNSGIENNASSLKSIAKGDKFIFRWRAGKGEIDSLEPENRLRLLVAKYTQDAPTRFGYYYKHIDSNNIILDFKVDETHTIDVLNNIIEGGTLIEGENGKYNYVIDTVVQSPSTKYVYINADDNQEYIWNGLTGDFELKTENNYLPYYYLVAEAQQAITNTSLTDVTERYGIFVYTTDIDTTTIINENTQESTTTINPIYIQDIQLSRFIPDGANDNKPIVIGNIPTAISSTTEYYYLKPSNGAIAEDIIMYTSPKELAKTLGINVDDIVALYNENSTKNLTISVSKSNCFNILQTIAETFECWVDLVVEHDESGHIIYTDGIPHKYVYLREYAGDNNYAGFKYGVNLNSIERTVNSDEFVTKLIVDQSQSEYVDEGYVSISLAPSNISNESYILNFDYYYNQGLLDREVAESDKLKFIQNIADLNLQLQEKEKIRRDLEASMTSLGSKRNVYTELIATAQDSKTDSLGSFENLTNRTYDEYQKLQTEAITYDNKFYVLTEDTEVQTGKKYYIYDDENEIFIEVQQPTGNPSEQNYYEILLDLTEEETIISFIGTIYVTSATINNYSGLLTNIESEYWKVREQLRGKERYSFKIWTGIDNNEQRHVYLELDDYLPGFSFEFEESIYESDVSTKYFDIESERGTEFTFFAPNNYIIKDAIDDTVTSYEINNSAVVSFKVNYIGTEPTGGIAAEIKEIQNEKDELTKNFNNKYSRYIQEGTWSSTDYIDSELYYLDALQVSNTSAQPTVSYTINVVEISELEGFEWYLFNAGDKTYIEDTEFFGWHIDNIGTQENPKLIYTPAKEEVIVSEVEWHLDEPDKNVITVQNYKTRFEDFFQRISATVQTVQYNETTYAKISSLVNPDGTINQNVLLESLNNISGKQYSLTSDGSVIIKDDVILIQNLTNPANRVIINSEGIRVSSDGGETWTTAIDGQGINIGTVYTGTLNTNEVVIGNKDNPSFRWDKAGISAFKFDGIDENNPYDLQTFVRFDQYGLYGIKDNGDFKAQSLQDIINKAHFAVTWDGFFIRNSYEDGGRVSITSENDFQVIDGTNTERIKIGSWIDEQIDERVYGINIKDKNGNSILSTDNDGDLTVTGTINAQAGEFSGLVQVGTSNPYIKIDGTNALIGTSNYQDDAGAGWMINAAGDAVFNNITARGAIKTAVFEYAEIQAVGGVFLFRPSSTIRSAAISGNNLVLSVEKPILFKVGQWCKVSNYIGKGQEPIDTQPILLNNGLTHVYRITNKETINGITYITLLDAAAMVEGQDAVIESVTDLIGGALVDMGNKAGTSNYGIGINSSDNTVNLPARAISLFETVVDETNEPKVTYNYRGILGTLPVMSSGVDSSIYRYMQGTQGIYTDNMYIGDATQFISFYTDTSDPLHPKKKLRIKANQIVFEAVDPETHEPTGEWHDVNQIETEGVPGPAGEDAAVLIIDSSEGTVFRDNTGTTDLTVTIFYGSQVITNATQMHQIFGNTSYLEWEYKDNTNNWITLLSTDPRISDDGFTLSVYAEDVYNKSNFRCKLMI